MEQLNRSGARILGVVLNRIPAKDLSYFGEYPYDGYQSDNNHHSKEKVKEVEEQLRKSRVSAIGRFFGRFTGKANF
jgi:Mrp family chromosome partitioning ATPase